MKKTLLSLAIAFVAIVAVNAQTVWNFSNAPFGVAGAAGGSAPISFAANYQTTDGLTIGTDGTTLWTGLTTNSKTIDGITYTYRLQTGGGGSPVSPSFIPVTRYLKINVSGACTINIGMISSSSSANRTLIIANGSDTFNDSIPNVLGSAAATYTYNYSGPAATLYLYSKSSGINYYYVSATNVVVTSVNKVLSDKGVSFNGTEILNNKGDLVLQELQNTPIKGRLRKVSKADR